MADEESTTPADTPAPDGTESTPSGLDIIKRERDDYYDRLLRQAAEFDNYRKRIERERRTQADQAISDLLLDLLLVVDDFDRAVAVSGEAGSAYRKGVELIHAKLKDLLRKNNVRPIDALGADFDPNVHQAVSYEDAGTHRDGEVIGEMARGYMMGDRLLRPAMVKVAKA